MHETRRFVEAAAALSQALQARGVPHAFHGNVMLALLSNDALAEVSELSTPSAFIDPLYRSKCPVSFKADQLTPSNLPARLSATRMTSQSRPRLGLIGAYCFPNFREFC